MLSILACVQDPKVALLFKKISETREWWAQEFQSWEEVHNQAPAKHDDDPYVSGKDASHGSSPASGDAPKSPPEERKGPEVASSSSKDPVKRESNGLKEQMEGVEGIEKEEDAEKLLKVLAEIQALESKEQAEFMPQEIAQSASETSDVICFVL